MRIGRKQWTVALGAALILGGAACDGTGTTLANDRIKRQAEELRSTYRANLEYVSEYAKSRGEIPASRQTIADGMLGFYAQRYGKESSTYQAMSASMPAFVSGGGPAIAEAGQTVPEYLQKIRVRVNKAVTSSGNIADLQQRLRDLQAAVLTDALTEEQKGAATSYLVLLEETLTFLNAHPEFRGGETAAGEMNAAGLPGWAKCLAGVVGDGLLGGLAGAGVGTALPAIGTTVGAVVGATGGALEGVASHC